MPFGGHLHRATPFSKRSGLKSIRVILYDRTCKRRPRLCTLLSPLRVARITMHLSHLQRNNSPLWDMNRLSSASLKLFSRQSPERPGNERRVRY